MHRSKEKKGISTLVAAIFMIMIIIIGVNVMTFALSSQNNFAQVLTEKNVSEVERIKENLEIREVKIVNNKFDITFVNTSGLPVKLDRIWVTDETANTQIRYDVTDPIILNPGETVTGVGQGTVGGLSLPATLTQSYTVKAVSERGSIVSFRTISASQTNNLQVALSVVPPTILVGEDVTIILSVINSEPNAQTVHEIVPILEVSGFSNCNDISGPVRCPNPALVSGPSPASVGTLPKGSTATFTWVYNIAQDGSSTSAGAIVTFTAGVGDNLVTSDVSITQVTISKTNFASLTGTITIEYESLEWKQSGTSCPWTKAWRIPTQSTGWTAFRINITNHDPDNDIRLDKRSVFFLDAVDGTANKVQFFLASAAQTTCNTNANPSAYTYDAFHQSGSNPITIPKDATQTVTVIFAAKTAGNNDSQKIGNSAVYAGYFVMFGRLMQDNILYGQNIPFMGFEIFPP
ncbi:MAG: hypothetical protein QXU32_00235 [Nitrososphaerales archaeon]